jgi:arylsulfatase A-like enzyme
MVFYGPGVSSKDSHREMRQVDILPTVLKAMGIDYDPSTLDGRALRLAKPQG